MKLILQVKKFNPDKIIITPGPGSPEDKNGWNLY